MSEWEVFRLGAVCRKGKLRLVCAAFKQWEGSCAFIFILLGFEADSPHSPQP